MDFENGERGLADSAQGFRGGKEFWSMSTIDAEGENASWGHDEGEGDPDFAEGGAGGEDHDGGAEDESHDQADRTQEQRNEAEFIQQHTADLAKGDASPALRAEEVQRGKFDPPVGECARPAHGQDGADQGAKSRAGGMINRLPLDPSGLAEIFRAGPAAQVPLQGGMTLLHERGVSQEGSFPAAQDPAQFG